MDVTFDLLLCGMATTFVGVLIEKFGRRFVMSVGALITASALISLSRAAALWHFYLAFGVFASIGSSMLHIVPLATIVSNWFVRSRGTAIGIVTGGSGVSHFVIVVLLQYLILRVGRRDFFLCLRLLLCWTPTD